MEAQKAIGVLRVINYEVQNPIHWTKNEQNHAIETAIGAIEKLIK